MTKLLLVSCGGFWFTDTRICKALGWVNTRSHYCEHSVALSSILVESGSTGGFSRVQLFFQARVRAHAKTFPIECVCSASAILTLACECDVALNLYCRLHSSTSCKYYTQYAMYSTYQKFINSLVGILWLSLPFCSKLQKQIVIRT